MRGWQWCGCVIDSGVGVWLAVVWVCGWQWCGCVIGYNMINGTLLLSMSFDFILTFPMVPGKVYLILIVTTVKPIYKQLNTFRALRQLNDTK